MALVFNYTYILSVSFHLFAFTLSQGTFTFSCSAKHIYGATLKVSFRTVTRMFRSIIMTANSLQNFVVLVKNHSTRNVRKHIWRIKTTRISTAY